MHIKKTREDQKPSLIRFYFKNYYRFIFTNLEFTFAKGRPSLSR